MRRITIYLPADLARKFMAACAERDVDVSSTLAELVSNDLANR